MKKFILISVMSFILVRSWAQGIEVRVAEVQHSTISQNGVNLSDTYGEGMVASETKEGIVIVHGFYSGIMADSMTFIQNVGEIPGLLVFPNPAHDGVYLASEIPPSTEYNVRLVTEDGVCLQQWNWPAGMDKLALVIGKIPSGKYFIKVVDIESGRMSTMGMVKL